MPRAPLPQSENQGSFDKSTLPMGIQPCTITDVFVTSDESYYAPYAQGEGYHLLYRFDIQPAGHKYSTSVDFYIRKELDDNGQLITYEEEGVEWNSNKKRGVQALWNFFDTIGYAGGLDPECNFLSHKDEEILEGEVADDIKDYLKTNVAEDSLLCFVSLRDNKDKTKKFVTIGRFIQPNSSDGMRVMKSTYKKERPASTASTSKRASASKPGRPRSF